MSRDMQFALLTATRQFKCDSVTWTEQLTENRYLQSQFYIPTAFTQIADFLKDASLIQRWVL